ncbi:MAG: hypothetical protein K2M08_07840 [Anaeroplasmataceae bacterium]|nr:hypothetical protein [Anaeroplasmataceae bacterium]
MSEKNEVIIAPTELVTTQRTYIDPPKKEKIKKMRIRSKRGFSLFQRSNAGKGIAFSLKYEGSFIRSCSSIFTLSLAFMLLFSLLSPNSDFTFKGVLTLLSNVRFSNNWLASFQDVVNVWKKFSAFNVSLPGDGWNIVLIFGEFWKFIATCVELAFNVAKSLFTLFIDFVNNIVVVLKFLAALGAAL